MSINPYANPFEHIKDELKLLDLKLFLLFNISRNDSDIEEQNDPRLKSIIIQEKELEYYFKDSSDFKKNEKIDDILKEINSYQKIISSRKKKSIKSGIILPIEKISGSLSLSDEEKQIILLCMAPEIDRKYQRIFAFLNDDLTKKKPTVDLAIKFLTQDFEERIKKMKYFSPNSRLIKFGIIEFEKSDENFISQMLKINTDLLSQILDTGDHTNKTNRISNLVRPARKHENIIVNPSHIEIIEKLREYLKIKKNKSNNIIGSNNFDKYPFVIYLNGKEGNWKSDLVKKICNSLKINLIMTDAQYLAKQDKEKNSYRYLLRELLIQDAILYIKNFDLFFKLDDTNKQNLTAFWNNLYEFYGIIFIEGEKIWPYNKQDIPRKKFLNIEFPDMTYNDRVHVWKSVLESNNITGIDPKQIAKKFKFSQDQIHSIVSDVLNFIDYDKDQSISESLMDSKYISPQIVYNFCNKESNKLLMTTATRIIPQFDMGDIILPVKKKQELEEIINYIKYREKVFGEWGFRKKIRYHEGLNILFYGRSGTGKTMAAEIIANELNLDLYKIDLSMIISKYIGETEKNINKIFQEAETSNSIIFFDEADAIFGKRVKIRDSHDRYSNTEINYLLQKLESHNEIIILATNFKDNMDSAFFRRIRFHIEFPFPEEIERLKIWKTIFPQPNFYLSNDISNKDFGFIAKNFQLSGANIRDAAISAAFLAASEGKNITIKHIIQSIKKEYEKEGRGMLKTEFERYNEI